MSAPDEVRRRVEELRAQVEHHARRYYVLDDPEIGDDEYDALLDELRAIEADHPELVTPDSPTQRVGGEPVSELQKVEHLQPMFSLANARSEEELRAWVGRMRNHLAREGIEDPEFTYVCEPKIDGLAMSLVYRDELKLHEEHENRRRYWIYGDSPTHVDEAGTDLAAVAAGRIAVTPLHFDLTDKARMDALALHDLSRRLEPAAEEV